MGVDGSRVGIVGGSVAGCAMAVAAGRLGCDVTVFEASSGRLTDRGAGIVIPLALRDELVAAGYMPAGAPYCYPGVRFWLTATPGEPAGRVMWSHDFPGAAHNWGVLWGALRGLVPDAAYRKGTAVRACRTDGDGATVTLDDGRVERFDVVVGADGYRSNVRASIHPDVRPAYAGYVLWRGNYHEDLLPSGAASAILERGFATVCFPGGHAVAYLIPGSGGGTGPGERRLNWAVYGTPPAGMDFTSPTSIPPGAVPAPLVDGLARIVADHLPPAWADVVRAGGPEGLSVQPIYDHAVPGFVSGRVLLVGDAAALSRPHTAGGATKAMAEGLAFEAAGRAHDAWPEVLAAFDADRRPVAADIVETSRLLGAGLVEHCPDWSALRDEAAGRYIRDVVAGRNLYMQPSSPSTSDVDGGADLGE